MVSSMSRILRRCKLFSLAVTACSVFLVTISGEVLGDAGTKESSVARLSAISTRQQVLTGDNVAIAGFIVDGTKKVVVRARGPSLGVAGALADPVLTLVPANGSPPTTNDDWQSAANAGELAASGFQPGHPKEAAILASLGPGSYTAIVSGVGNTTGLAIVEAYVVDMPQASCSAPPTPPTFEVGTTPSDDEPPLISDSVATVEGASPVTFNPANAPITFRLSCSTLKIGPGSVVVYDNGLPRPYSALTLTPDSVTLTGGLAAGRHELNLLAEDIFGYTIEHTAVLWVGNSSMPVQVLDEAGAPVAGAVVVAKLSDDPGVTATLVTDATGSGTFHNLPNRSFNILASASGNRIATSPATVSDGQVVLRLKGFEAASTTDNNDFSQGTAGWNIGNAPVTLVPHVEGSLGTALALNVAPSSPGPRTAERAAELASYMAYSGSIAATAGDFDLKLSTSGQGQQSISRSFNVEDGIKSITVRYRFITSEVPGGYFGSQFNDFFNVSIRTVRGGGSVNAGNSMNGLGLGAFDSSGATAWFEVELPIVEGGDTVQVNVSVANVADGLYDSQVLVDAVKKTTITISELSLRDIDNANLQFLSASSHAYFSGSTRVHGTLTVKGASSDSLQELKLEVLEGGAVVATGQLIPGLAPVLYRQFGAGQEIRLDTPQLMFQIPSAQLAGVNQGTNGVLTLRVKARSASGQTAQRDFGAVTKLVLFTGGTRYGGRDAAVGGDDWVKPTVRTLLPGTGLLWGDFSNMNGGPFSGHTLHRTGNSVDGWFAGYNVRNAATAATIIGHLNTYGMRIRAVYVTFAPNSAFANAIANVTLNDGRSASAVIRNAGGHTTHFHWEVTD